MVSALACIRHWGPISLVTVMNIYLFYMRDRRFKQLMSAASLTRSRYIRLMCVSATEILGTIPLGTLYIVKNAKLGVEPWRGWAYTHENYSAVYQIPSSIWRNTPDSVFALEMYRWSLVLCAFLFFALFGFADEARRHYRSMYASIASRIGYSTSALHRSSHACVVHSLCGFIATHGYSFFSQYFISPLRKEQRRQDRWRETGSEHLAHQPVFDPVRFHRQWP